MIFKVFAAFCFLMLAWGIDSTRKEIAALQATQDQTVDFLSDVHAERAK